MKDRTLQMLDDLILRYPNLFSCKKDLGESVNIFSEAYNKGNKILTCGNGGSAADAEHISGELLKGFMSKRSCSEEEKCKFEGYGEDGERLFNNLQKGIPAIPLSSLSSAMTAFMNDCDPDLVYGQLVFALGRIEDVLIAISTSGNSNNIYYAALTAKICGIKIIGLTGESGGKLKDLCDVCIRVPESETYKIQELHLPVYHYLCAGLESELFEV